MNVLSLFSGIGGLDLGLERAGMTIVGQVEIDPWCQRVLARHWPEVPRHDDVRTAVTWWRSAPRPPIDLICGGFPCQPVSVAGKRLAQADERWLWPAMAAVIRGLRPRFALMENVPGLLVSGMGDVLGDLAACGYDAEWDCVSAAAVGAPHLRERVWIVAYPQRGELRQQPVPESWRGREAIAGHDGAAWTVADPASLGFMAGDGEHLGGGARTAVAARRPERITSELVGFAGERRPVADAEGQRGELRAAAGERPGRPASGGPELADANGAPDRHGHDGTRTIFPHRTTGHEGIRRALRDPDFWSAEPGVGRVAHGIPARVDRLRGLGNAVVPQVAEHIGKLIMEAAA